MSNLKHTAPAPAEARKHLPIADEWGPVNTSRDLAGAQTVGLGSAARDHAGPNVLIVLLDDMGFGASSPYGGPCRMPTAERLAESGLRYTRFHTTALCSPTRQSLMTGRNHHAVNMAGITHMATSVPGYTSVRPNTAATLPEVLRLNGYATGAFGKMHQTPQWESTPAGPFDRWPTGEGFERFYGFLDGESDQYNPLLYDGPVPVEKPDDPDYHFSVDITDHAIDWVRMQNTLAPDRPFFCYLSFGATHAPHHAPQSWIEKYRGRFDAGWDAERERILASQQALGVVPEAAELTARHSEIPAWADLSDKERMVAARLMEAYAGFAEHTDHQVGRLLDALDGIDRLENTLVFYILGDNGASAEGGIHGTINEKASLNGVHHSLDEVIERLDEIGSETSFNHYPAGWAHAMDTPYQWTKQVASHWGGTRVGMIVHWPAGIEQEGGVRNDWRHVNDIYPTVLEALGLPVPETVAGVAQQRLDGTSMTDTFAADTVRESGVVQYFEMFGNRGIYADGWSACTKHGTPWSSADTPAFADDRWELYAPDDWTQVHDLAAQMPEKLRELKELFDREAVANKVYPLDDRRKQLFNPDIAGRPDLARGRLRMRLHPGMRRLPESAIPNVKNKSFAVTSAVTVGEGADGALLSQGDRFGGWLVHMVDGRPAYTHNYFSTEVFTVAAVDALAPGEHVLRMDFTVDEEPGFGRGGTVVLTVDGAEAARGRVPKAVPFIFSGTTDVGCDTGSGIISGYRRAQGGFTGDIEYVDVEIFPDAGALPTPPQKARQIAETIQ